MINQQLSRTPEGERTTWETPQALYDRYDRVWRFNLDAAALPESARCPRFACPPTVWDSLRSQDWIDDGPDQLTQFTPTEVRHAFRDGLALAWHEVASRVWLNPPYGRTIGRWLAKARNEAEHGCLVVALIPVDPSTRWWQQSVQGVADVHYLTSRVRFGGAESSPSFASAVAIYWPSGMWDGHR